MTRWLWLVALPGGSLIVAAVFIGRWISRRRRQGEVGAELAQLLIKSPVVRFTGHDEALQQRTRRRRDAANQIRERAAQVESGVPVSDVLRRVK